MRSRWFRSMLVLVFTMALVAAACGGDDNGASDGASGGASGGGGTQDLLAKIEADGVIRVSTDPAYPPQSYLNPDTGEYEGFDIDVATEIAKRLGVDVAWEAPSWDLIIAGSWNDRWDMSVGSMTVTPQRAEVLYFTPAYYYTPAVVAVHQDNTTIQDVATDLDGKTIGVAAGTTYDYFLQKTLEIPGYTFDFIIDDCSHRAAETSISFWHLFHDHLRPGGIYAIEDWGTGYWSDFGDRGEGMVGFVKSLVDECGRNDRERGSWGGRSAARSEIASLTVMPGLAIARKP